MDILDNAKIYKRDEEIPKKSKLWFYVPIFKKNSLNSEMLWQIGYDAKNNIMIILHGHMKNLKDVQVEKVSIELNNSNRDHYEQSLLEIRHKYDKKVEQEYYSPDRNFIPTLLSPMLGQQYEKHKDKIVYPVMVSKKLDGIRCLVRKENGIIKFRSRQNKSWSWSTKQKQMIYDFKILLEDLPEGTEIDGELYNHDLKFEEITSIVKREKDYSSKDWEQIKYYAFDLVIEGDFEKRYKKLNELIEKYESVENYDKIVLVKNIYIKNEEELQKEFSKSIGKGYEGLMIRMLYSSDKTKRGLERSSYLHKRCVNILKLKALEDDEGEIVDVYSGEGREKDLALFVLKMKNGKTFNVRPQGTAETRRRWYEDKDNLIGKEATYVYQELSADGIPKFASLKTIRDYE